jgi:hypothetical protein
VSEFERMIYGVVMTPDEHNTENTAANTYRFTLANRVTSATVTQVYASELTADQPWEIGASNALFPAHARYRLLAVATGTEAANLTGSDLQAACNRLYQTF